MKPSAKHFKELLVKTIEESQEHHYGKEGLILLIERVYSELLERYIED